MHRILLLILAALVLSGCGPITSGTVIERKHEDERYYEEYDSCARQEFQYHYGYHFGEYQFHGEPHCVGDEVTRFDDEDWKIRLEKCEEPETPSGIQGSPGSEKKKSSDKPKCERAWYEIDSTVYATLKVGDFYNTKGQS